MVRGQLGMCRFCESGVKWRRGDSLVCIGSVSQVLYSGEVGVCIGSVSQVLDGGEGTVGTVYRFRC